MALHCGYCDKMYSPGDPSKIIGCDCEGAKAARAEAIHKQIKDAFNRLRVAGVSRVGDNAKVLMVSFDREPTDDELRKVHQHLERLL